MGLASTLNSTLKKCDTELIARMDADDISFPGRFAFQIEFLDANPDVVIVGTQIEFLIGGVAQKALPAPIFHDEIERRFLEGRAGLCHPSLMFRTKDAKECGGYPLEGIGEDIDFCLRMCERGNAANSDRVLFQYRLHSAQLCQSKSKELIIANRYWAYRAINRRKGVVDLGLKEFIRNASFIERMRWSIEAWELTQYRTGRIQIANGKPLNGAFRLAFLAICCRVASIRRCCST